MQKISLLIVLTLSGALVVNSNQASQTKTQEQKAETQEHTKSMPKRDIELTIALVGYDDRAADYVTKNHYRVGERISVSLTMTNQMQERTVIGWGDTLSQNHLKLQKDGQEVEYLPGIANHQSSMDKHGYAGSVKPIKLLPNVSKRVGISF